MLRKKIISPSMVVMVLGMLVATLDARQIDDVSCPSALFSLLPCLPFLQGVGPATPTSYCCAGITDLNQKANTTQIRRDVCNCLKPAASRFGVNPDRLKQLPTLCNITLNVPFDPSVDCNTVQ
ncbi:putative plant lipid transfer protein/Par allergen [Medicago truncatula]|uniref:Non-specific lipid-transfer protein n=1 Tax=Medicago truncatula TaxID=3880 RepID=A0A396IT38_MEDTR|nr:putative plant lipid transfer protein/Par allergen [Medicago truncatula]